MIAAIATLVLVVSLGALHWFDPVSARAFVVEHGPVEWTQVALLLAGWMITAWCAIRLLFGGQPIVPEMLLGTLLTVAISAELSVHNWAGFRIRHWRLSFRLSARLVFAWVVFSICLIIFLAVARYMVRHRRTLLGVLRGLPRSRWGQLTMVGCGGYALTQLFEHRLARLMPRPSYFLEETIELVATLCLFLAARQRAQVRSDETHQRTNEK